MTQGGWRLVGASVRGTSHDESGAPCQDASDSRVVVTPTGEAVLTAAVSDGAGSATRAEEGARIACATILESLEGYLSSGGRLGHLSKDDAIDWIELIGQRIADRAEAEGQTPRDFAATLLAVAVDAEYALCMQIGDGAIVLGNGEEYLPVFWPQNGEYANMTYFVTDRRAAEQLQFTTLAGPIADVALLSDGLQMLALRYNTREAHVPFFQPMFARLRAEAEGESQQLASALAEFLGSKPVNDRTNDDKTLLLATRPLPAAMEEAIAESL